MTIAGTWEWRRLITAAVVNRNHITVCILVRNNEVHTVDAGNTLSRTASVRVSGINCIVVTDLSIYPTKVSSYFEVLSGCPAELTFNTRDFSVSVLVQGCHRNNLRLLHIFVVIVEESTVELCCTVHEGCLETQFEGVNKLRTEAQVGGITTSGRVCQVIVN